VQSFWNDPRIFIAQYMGAQPFQKCNSHLKIPATRTVTRQDTHCEHTNTRVAVQFFFFRPSDLALGICASWNNTPKTSPNIKYRVHYTPLGFHARRTTRKCNSIENVYKVPGQTPRVSSLHRNEDNIPHKYSRKCMAFEFNGNNNNNNNNNKKTHTQPHRINVNGWKVSNQPRDHKLATFGPIIHGMNQSPIHYKI
jgi:hypothetical protein